MFRVLSGVYRVEERVWPEPTLPPDLILNQRLQAAAPLPASRIRRTPGLAAVIGCERGSLRE